MLVDNALFPKFAAHIAALPNTAARSDLRTPSFRLYQNGDLEIYYVPLEYLNEKARIALVGITPGSTQMERAFRAARDALSWGWSPSEVCAHVDREASFAGPIRRNLTGFLDGLGIPAALGIESSMQLFGAHNDLLHTTAVVRYSIFVRGANYTGHNPPLLKTPVLRRYVEEALGPELQRVPDALVVPMGKSVSDALQLLIDGGRLDSARCLLGFPHPSGANMHRTQQYANMQERLREVVKAWFAHSL
jgi:hypothetical protein